jgi:hypothetical protein
MLQTQKLMGSRHKLDGGRSPSTGSGWLVRIKHRPSITILVPSSITRAPHTSIVQQLSAMCICTFSIRKIKALLSLAPQIPGHSAALRRPPLVQQYVYMPVYFLVIPPCNPCRFMYTDSSPMGRRPLGTFSAHCNKSSAFRTWYHPIYL